VTVTQAEQATSLGCAACDADLKALVIDLADATQRGDVRSVTWCWAQIDAILDRSHAALP
jgi:hypothetical protein